MSSDYLWDGSGEPDPEIRKLEDTLGALRHRRPAPAFPDMPVLAAPARARWFDLRAWPALAGVAAGMLLIAALGPIFRSMNSEAVAPPGWDITALAGAPRVDAHSGKGKLIPGQTLETDSRSHANLRAEEVGEIDVEPGSRLRLLDLASGKNRLALDRGTIHATIWAPAGEFVIDTPSAVAVDLGCSYTLKVDDAGNGVLRTSLGWVGFKLNGREAFIPAGAACATKPKTGPGTPYFEDAAESFRAALAKLDDEGTGTGEHTEALHIVLTQSRERDALTLWHLLVRVPENERGMVYDRLAKLVPAPEGVTREGILRLDQTMLDQWWNELGFGDVGLWRHWERSYVSH
jgi:hypothetical protein